MSATVKIRVYLVMQAPSNLPKGLFSPVSPPLSVRGICIVDRVVLSFAGHIRSVELHRYKTSSETPTQSSPCSLFCPPPPSLSLSLAAERYNGLTSIFFGASARGYSPPLLLPVLFNTVHRDFATWNREDGSAADKIDEFNGRPQLDASPTSSAYSTRVLVRDDNRLRKRKGREREREKRGVKNTVVSA